VGDDYFGGPAAPGSGQAPAQGFSSGYAPTPAPVGVTMSQAGLAAVGVGVAGLLMCLGAWGPWLRATGFGANLDYGGMHAGLDGKWVMALGLATIVLGVLLYATPSGHGLRSITAIATVVIAVVGLVVVVHQYVELSDKLSDINGALGAFLKIHVESGWGLWLAGFGCAGAGATGVLSLVS
jgi:hypothetical protein